MARNGSHTPYYYLSNWHMTKGIQQKTIREAYASMHEPESVRRIADIYWTVLVWIGTVLMLGSVGYGMWLFFVEPTREASEVTIGVGGSGFDRAQLQKAVDALQKRRDEFESLLK